MDEVRNCFEALLLQPGVWQVVDTTLVVEQWHLPTVTRRENVLLWQNHNMSYARNEGDRPVSSTFGATSVTTCVRTPFDHPKSRLALGPQKPVEASDAVRYLELAANLRCEEVPPWNWHTSDMQVNGKSQIAIMELLNQRSRLRVLCRVAARLFCMFKLGSRSYQ